MNEENTHPYDEGGSVFYGCTGPQKLLPALLNALEKIAKAKGEHWQLADHIYLRLRSGWDDYQIPSYIWDDDQSPWWNSDECEEVIEELIGALHDCAPTGYWFGVDPERILPDYGFWEIKEEGQ